MEEQTHVTADEKNPGKVAAGDSAAAEAAAGANAQLSDTVAAIPGAGALLSPAAEALLAVREDLGDCHRCPLWETRTNIVFGTGNPNARVLIIGEAPGKNEDLSGQPFVGAAGKRLDELLAIAGLSRDDVYIANVLKCRPPGNRNPHVTEVQTCAPFLRAQTRAIRPQVIVCLGNFATHFILRTEQGITDLRGRFHRAGPFEVLPVFHPAAAIYDRKKWPLLEQDFALLGTFLKGHYTN